jgi:hypothetical protein
MPGDVEFVQVLVARRSPGWELRHVADRDRDPTLLRETQLSELRALAQLTAEGEFRPLRAAPNLQSGWRVLVNNEAEVETALDTLYPGAIADWSALQASPVPVTDFREFTARQTGMYRVTQGLSDAQAGWVTTACCAGEFCLKRRLWTVPGTAIDAPEAKSLIPCLEPCAVLLEFARKIMRIEQEAPGEVALRPSEVVTAIAGLEALLARRTSSGREADFSNPENPRRIRLLLEKLRRVAPPSEAEAEP